MARGSHTIDAAVKIPTPFKRARGGRHDAHYSVVIRHAGRRRWHSLDTADLAEARRRTRDLLALYRAENWAAIASLRHRSEATFSTLAAEWQSLGCPTQTRTPRTPAQRRALAPYLTTALVWWGTRAATSVSVRLCNDYLAHRRATAQQGTAARAAELELRALSALLEWAVADERLPSNALRPLLRNYRADTLEHHAAHAPRSDDELQQILAAAWRAGRRVEAAQLCWCALTGQRPGEPGALRWDASDPTAPGYHFTPQAGDDRTPRVILARFKHGQNPAARLHPALSAFLGAWRLYTQKHWPTSPWYFPHPCHPDRPLTAHSADRAGRRRLQLAVLDACAACGLPRRTPHSLRAYYVAVRRSQGATDGTIADELGQRSGARLVQDVYGTGDQVRGAGHLDFLPSSVPPLWALIAEECGLGTCFADATSRAPMATRTLTPLG